MVTSHNLNNQVQVQEPLTGNRLSFGSVSVEINANL